MARTECQGRVGRNTLDTLLAISELGGDDKLALTTDLHAGNSLVPASDDFSLSELEGEWCTLGVLVEDLAAVGPQG